MAALSRAAWIVAVFIFSLVAQRVGASDALALQQRLISVFEQNKDAVVRVKAAYRQKTASDEGPRVTLRVGTGFFISREGHVLVSASRASGADRVWVEYLNKPYATEVIGHDELTNVSVLKVLELPESFSIIQIDANVPSPKLGAIAFAISCPLDFAPSPSFGIVSGMDQRLGKKAFPTKYLRTSISVDAGQGGCPILDVNGRFIGMSVASIPDIEGSYCLPVDALIRVRDDLMFSGEVIHSWLGFEVAEPLESDEPHGVYLSKIIEDAPAANAGLLVGDNLVSIGGREILEVSDVPGAVFFTRPNQFTTIEVIRDGEPKEVSVKTLPRPEKEPIIDASIQAGSEVAVSPSDRSGEE